MKLFYEGENYEKYNFFKIGGALPTKMLVTFHVSYISVVVLKS